MNNMRIIFKTKSATKFRINIESNNERDGKQRIGVYLQNPSHSTSCCFFCSVALLSIALWLCIDFLLGSESYMSEREREGVSRFLCSEYRIPSSLLLNSELSSQNTIPAKNKE